MLYAKVPVQGTPRDTQPQPQAQATEVTLGPAAVITYKIVGIPVESKNLWDNISVC